MNLLQSLKDNQIKLPFNLGKEIGSGIDGQVFEKSEDSTKVIKLSAIYIPDAFCSNYEMSWKILNYLFTYRPSHFAEVFSFGVFNILSSSDPHLIQYVEMERLLPLSDDERKTMNSLLSHEDANKQKFYDSKKIKELSHWLTFDVNKMDSFCLLVTSNLIKQRDLHERNIMKDVEGNFKLIDFDRLEFK